MNKFFEWMKYKEYITDLYYKLEYEPTNQMLVGYMFEYLMERYKNLENVDMCIGGTIEEFYDNLKRNIEELDK